MDARGKFGEHEKCARVARGAAESNSSILLKAWANSFITERQQGSARRNLFMIVPDRVQNSHNAQKKKESNVPIG